MKESYHLIPSKIFAKDLKKLPADIKPKIEEALLKLKNDPYSGKHIKKLSSVDIGMWRLCIGDWRIRYDVIGKEIRLHVIRRRKDIYRKK